MDKMTNDGQIGFLDNEIVNEMKDNHTMEIDECVDKEYKEELENELLSEKIIDPNKTTRHPFRIESIDKGRDKQREMAVFTHAKKLAEYILVITQKSPKKFRWSVVTRLQNSSVGVVNLLYLANFDKPNREEHLKRCNVELSLLDFYAETCKRMQAINTRQLLIIGKQITEVRKMLQGWIKSMK